MLARCSLVVAAALVGAAAPGGARGAGLEQLTNLAGQVQAATWREVAGARVGVETTSGAQATADRIAQTVREATRAALAGADVHETVGAVAGATSGEIVADASGRGGFAKATPRAATKRAAPARLHEKARPRMAAVAASPTLLPQPVEQPRASETVQRSQKPAEKRTGAPSAARGPRVPSLPFDLPPVPFPLAMPSSVGAGSGGGSPVPPLLVALAAALSLFVSEVVIRRVPSRRPVRPRRIVLPPWRPG